jgi:hypothetical protein
MKRLTIFFIALISITSCKKEKDEVINPIGKLGTVQLVFDNVVGNDDLLLDSAIYSNSFDEEFTVRKFNYFISNIELKQKDGSYIKMFEDSSYFLIKEKDKFSHTANLNWVNEAEYTGIRFIVGVDSLRSRMPKSMQNGVLDQGGYAADMYWTWNQGYIFLKLECNKPVIKGDSSQIPYVYHIGGYGGFSDSSKTINNIRTISLDFPSNINVLQSRKSKVNIQVDLMKVLTGPNPIQFSRYPTVMLTPFSLKVSENYMNMFSVTSVE